MSAASAQVLFHVLNDLSATGLRIFDKQSVAPENHPGRAKSTLHSPLFREGFLDWMEFPVGGKTLDRDHVFAGDTLDRELAGPNGFLVDNYGAGAALVVAASEFCAGQAQISAQYPQERSITIGGDGDSAAVEVKTNGLLHRNYPFWL
jgi:hypothetical protein